MTYINWRAGVGLFRDIASADRSSGLVARGQLSDMIAAALDFHESDRVGMFIQYEIGTKNRLSFHEISELAARPDFPVVI
jgi:hypothetical protein